LFPLCVFLLCFPAACLVRLLTNEIALVCLLTNEMLVLHFAISILLLLLTFFFPLDFIFSLRSLHLQFSFTVFSSNFLLTPILFFCLQLPDGAAFKIKIDTGNFIYSKMSLPNILPVHTSFTGTIWYPQKVLQDTLQNRSLTEQVSYRTGCPRRTPL
jgi:hypothetical protein